MTPEQIRLIEESWKSVDELGDAAIQAFYSTLFSKAPQARAMFPDDMVEQRRKLKQALALAVANLRRLDELGPKLAELGARHVDYGTKPEHYPVVGEALLDTLASAFGEAWSAELADAWGAAFTLISQVMIDGAARRVSAA
ncbi:MAG: globin family protein [Deltaproteobacteria bacterium]